MALKFCHPNRFEFERLLTNVTWVKGFDPDQNWGVVRVVTNKVSHEHLGRASSILCQPNLCRASPA